MSKDHLYTLEIHIDSCYITKQSLIENAEYALKSYLGKIEWDIDDSNSVYHRFIVIGDINSIDNCHNLIQQSIINRKDLKFYHYIDEVGDKIRELAYPILAGIEQHFRAFINKVLVEVLGFDWWEKYKLKEIPEKVNQRYNDYKKDQVAPSFLECSDFDHLVNIIMAEVSELPLKKDVKSNEFSNIVKNISETINNCQTLDEFNKFKRNWNEQNKIISLWGIFASYFEDQEEWEKLKKELQSFVIDVRNKVMHHRPIRYHVIEKLKEVKQRLIEIFNSASLELTEEVRIEVQQETETILRSQELQRYFNRSLEPSINRYFEQVKDDITHFDQFIMETRNAIKSPFNEFITETKNGIKNSFNESITSAKIGFSKEIDDFIMGTRNAVKSPFHEFITETKKVIQNPLNESILSSRIGFSKEINENIFPPLPKKDFLSLPAEQLRKQMSEKLRPSSGIQDVIEAFERENTLRQKVETPLENLRKFFY